MSPPPVHSLIGALGALPPGAACPSLSGRAQRPAPTAAVLGLLFLLLFLGLASPAAADEPTIGLAVLPARGGDLAAGRSLASRVMRQFSDDTTATLVDVMPLVQQMSRPPRPDYLQQLQQSIDQLSRGDYGSARRGLTRVMGRMRGALAAVRLEELAFVQLHLAAAELGSGRRRSARRTLAELAIWRRGQLPALSGPAPTDWEDLLAETPRPEGGVGSLEVVSSPEGAWASLDGRPLGATPVMATNLPEGTHYLEVSLPGYKPTVTAVPVKVRRRSVSVQLVQDPEAAATVNDLLAMRPNLGKTRLWGLGRLGHQLGLDKILLVTVLPTGQGLRLRGFLYDMKSERLAASSEVKTPASPMPGQLQPLRLWSGGVVSMPANRDDSFTPVAPQGPSRPWYKRWYVWVVVGSAVAAAVILPATLAPRAESSPKEQYVLSW